MILEAWPGRSNLGTLFVVNTDFAFSEIIERSKLKQNYLCKVKIIFLYQFQRTQYCSCWVVSQRKTKLLPSHCWQRIEMFAVQVYIHVLTPCPNRKPTTNLAGHFVFVFICGATIVSQNYEQLALCLWILHSWVQPITDEKFIG